MREVSVGTVLTDDMVTGVFAVPTGYYAKWNLSYVVNHTGSNKGITVTWFDLSTDTEINILDNYQLSTTQFVKFDGGAFVVLEEGDSVLAKGDTGAIFHLVNTFELIRK